MGTLQHFTELPIIDVSGLRRWCLFMVAQQQDLRFLGDVRAYEQSKGTEEPDEDQIGQSQSHEPHPAGLTLCLSAERKTPGHTRWPNSGHPHADDSPDAMFAYSMTFDQCGIEPWIAHWRCDQAAPPLESLIGLGVDTQPRSSTYRVSTPCPCGHKAASGGRSLVSTLLRRATSLGVEVRTGVRVEWLRTEDERVTGVRSGAGEIEAGAVILASGGLGPNTELLRELYPAAASGIEPRLLQRLSFDTAHTPVAHGEAVSVVGESAVPGLPAGLVWRPLTPAATTEIHLLTRGQPGRPAVARLLRVVSDTARASGWLRSPGTATCDPQL
jgi:hypothetical protein